MSELPPERKPDELSVRDKAAEAAPGVFVTGMATRPFRIRGSASFATNSAESSDPHKSGIIEHAEPAGDEMTAAVAERVTIAALTALSKSGAELVAEDVVRRAGQKHCKRIRGTLHAS